MIRKLINILSDVCQMVHETSVPHPIRLLLVTLQWLMRMSFFFKDARWRVWQTDNEQQLIYFNRLFGWFNVSNIFLYQLSFEFIVSFILVIVIHSCSIAALLFSSILTKNQKVLGQYCCWYFLLLRWIIFIPSMEIIISALYITEIPLTVSGPIGAFAGILIIVIYCFQLIMMRKHWLGYQQPLISQYTNIALLTLGLEVSIIWTEHLEQSNFIEVVEIILLLSYWVTLFSVELYYPSGRPLNSLRLGMHSIGLMTALFVSSQVVTDSQYGNENVMIFLFLCWGYALWLSHSIGTKYRHHVYWAFQYEDKGSREYELVYNVEEIYWFYKDSQNNLNSRVKLMFLYSIHKNCCQSSLCKQATSKVLRRKEGTLSKKYCCLIILCILQRSIRMQSIHTHSSLKLLYISFLHSFCNSPIIAYLELKQQLLNSNYYLRFLYPALATKIELKLKQLQKRHLKKTFSLSDDKQITVEYIHKVYEIESKLIPMIVQILDCRKFIWQKLINGIERGQQFMTLLVMLGQNIKNCEHYIHKQINIDISTHDWQQQVQLRCYELKMLQLFYSAVKTDPSKARQIMLFLEEVLKYESMVQSDKIKNITLMDEKLIIIEASMLKSKGLLLNKDRNFAQFFGFRDLTECQLITHINQLIPEFFQGVHDRFVDDFLEKGVSRLMNSGSLIFVKNHQGWIEMGNLRLDNFFEIRDDYVLTASLFKTNENQQFIIFDGNGKILGITEKFVKQLGDLLNCSLKEVGYYSYIQFLMPSLFEILDSQRAEINALDGETQTQEIQSIFTIGPQLFHIIKGFNQEAIDKQIVGKVESSHLQQTHKTINKRYDSVYSKYWKSKDGDTATQDKEASLQGYPVRLYDQQYREFINAFIGPRLQSLKGNMFYFSVKCILNWSLLGQHDTKVGYFIMELKDIKPQNPLVSIGTSSYQRLYYRYNASTIANFEHELGQQRLVDEEGNQLNGSISFQDILTTPTPINTLSLISQMGNFSSISRVVEKDLPQVHLDEEGDQEGRYRPIFKQFQPKHIYEMEEQNEFDQDFRDLMVLSARSIRQPEIKFIMPDEQDGLDQLPQSNSQSWKPRNQNETNVAGLLKRQQELDIDKHFEDQDLEAKASKASTATSQSSQNGTSIIRQLQNRNSTHFSIKLLIFINIWLFILEVGLLITNSLISIKFKNDYEAHLANFQVPNEINSLYCEIISLSWIKLYDEVGVHRYSEYIKLRILVEAHENLNAGIFNKLYDMLPILMFIQQAGLVPPLETRLNTGEIIELSLLEFLDTVQVSLQTNSRVLLGMNELDIKVIQEFYFLRQNLAIIIKTNYQLVQDLKSLLIQSLEENENMFIILMVFELLALLLSFFIQLYPWIKLQRYYEKLLLINSRVSEKDARQLIIQLETLKDTLNRQSQISWKKFDDYTFIFQERIQRLKDKQSSKHQMKSQSDKTRRTFSQSLLTGRIGNIHLKVLKQLMIISGLFITFALYIIFDYVISNTQNVSIRPALDMQMNFLELDNNLDTLMTVGLLVKTHNLVEDTLMLSPDYIAISSLFNKDPQEILDVFVSTEKIYANPLFTILQNIQELTSFTDGDRQILLDTYRGDLCQVIPENIPFCQYSVLDNDRFDNEFGKSITNDNNLRHMQDGIIGIFSDIQIMVEDIFQYEKTFKSFVNNPPEVLAIIQSKTFNNIIVQHFTSAQYAMNYFQDHLHTAIDKIIQTNLQLLLVYIIITGILIILPSTILMSKLILNASKETKFLYYSLSNLPCEVLNESQTKNLLKGL